VVVSPFDVSIYPEWMYDFDHTYYMNVGDTFELRFPIYTMPDANNQDQEEKVVWDEGTDEVPFPAVVSEVQLGQRMMTFNANSPEHTGTYEFTVTVDFTNYGVFGSDVTLTGTFKV